MPDFVMPGLGPGIHEYLTDVEAEAGELVDGRAKPDHDDCDGGEGGA